MAVAKIDPKVIFASEAPVQDTPAVFTNKTVGWGESRKNGGRPTIKQSNALQQETDLKILWLNENSVTPFDATIDYPENAVTIKDGIFKILKSGIWELFLDKSSVGLGNVDDTSDLNKPVSTATQTALNLKADKSTTYTKSEVNNALDLLKPPYLSSDVVDGSQTQDQINLYGGKKYDMPVGGYPLNARVLLDNGDIVKSTIDGNVNDPNVDMTSWIKTNAASQIFDISGLTQQEINGLIGSPLMFGAKGNDVFDDTLAIQECANKFRYLDMRNGNWKTTGKITLREGTVVDLRGSYLSANNANEPIFEFENAGDGLSILGGGGYVYGTADSFLKCSGKTYQPTMQTDYARQIRLDGIHVSGTDIDKFLDFDKAVRQVFMTKVFSYTRNGMFCNGKCVEIEIYGSIIYGGFGVDDLTTYGIKYVSPGGGRWYNEGLHITDSTIDNFGTTFDIRDIYAMSVTGGHIGAAIQSDGNNAPGALVAKFGQPTSTACRDIKFNGVNIYGVIEFAPVGGLEYQAKFTGCSSEAGEGANISIKNNASSITVSNHTFHSSTNGVAVVCQSNNFNISVNDITCDSTFGGGVYVLGSAGTGILINGIQYSGTGNAIYLERPVRLANVPINAATKDYIQKFNTSSIQGSHIVGANITSVENWFAKGETGVIVCELTYTGASASQVLTITPPTGMSIPSGTGWSSGAIMLNTIDGRVSLAIPYIVTQDIPSGAIVLKNDTGNTISLGYHSYFGFKRD